MPDYITTLSFFWLQIKAIVASENTLLYCLPTDLGCFSSHSDRTRSRVSRAASAAAARRWELAAACCEADAGHSKLDAPTLGRVQQHLERTAPFRCAYKFPATDSFRIALSSSASVNRRFSRTFSFPSSLRRFAWSIRRPPYSFFHRQCVCSATPICLQASGIFFPRGSSTSVSRSLR